MFFFNIFTIKTRKINEQKWLFASLLNKLMEFQFLLTEKNCFGSCIDWFTPTFPERIVFVSHRHRCILFSPFCSLHFVHSLRLYSWDFVLCALLFAFRSLITLFYSVYPILMFLVAFFLFCSLLSVHVLSEWHSQSSTLWTRYIKFTMKVQKWQMYIII